MEALGRLAGDVRAPSLQTPFMPGALARKVRSVRCPTGGRGEAPSV